MIEEAEAYQILDDRISAVEERVLCALCESLGRTVAKDFVSVLAMPRFANAMVDGYALPAGNHEAGTTFQVVGEQPAGVDRELSLNSGEAARIFTGAPLPKGTESVIMQEVVSMLEGGVVRLEETIDSGKGVRQEGDDLCAGQKILSAGDVITPQRAALLASQGVAEIEVRPLPRVHVISTGDELKGAGETLAPGELYESNALMLCLLGESQGWPGWTSSHVVDDPSALQAAVSDAAARNDFLFLSGGVSVGEHDHVRGVLEALGFEEHFWRVRVQPGKPVLFGTLGNCHVLGLPGNPVSSFVSFHLFGVRAIRHWLGQGTPEIVRARLNGPTRNRGKRPHYLRGWFDQAAGTFGPVGLQRSHGMLGLSKANALARLPAEADLSEGAEVELLRV